MDIDIPGGMYKDIIIFSSFPVVWIIKKNYFLYSVTTR